MKTHATYIRFFHEIGIDDVPLVGGKNASLGQMYQDLAPQGVKVPNGFAAGSSSLLFARFFPTLRRVALFFRSSGKQSHGQDEPAAIPRGNFDQSSA